MGATSEKLRNHIPYDLTFFILSKLPSKSLKKFGCVHKLWTLVFQNLYFMSMFHNNFISNNHSYCDVLSLLRRPTMSSILSGFNSSLFSLSGERFKIALSKQTGQIHFKRMTLLFLLRGLLVLLEFFVDLFQVPNKIVLWNLTTGDFKVIPPTQLNLYHLTRTLTLFLMDLVICVVEMTIR